jgi:hypothetical protein
MVKGIKPITNRHTFFSEILTSTVLAPFQGLRFELGFVFSSGLEPIQSSLNPWQRSYKDVVMLALVFAEQLPS